MGNSSSSNSGSSMPAEHPQGNVSECPVMRKKGAEGQESEQQGQVSECPVMRKKDKIYNVYSQEINPDNNMPFNANQLPAPGQKKPLSTERVTSGIPKGASYSQHTPLIDIAPMHRWH
jgi:hypothetical protein